jgi:hypothetical protein
MGLDQFLFSSIEIMLKQLPVSYYTVPFLMRGRVYNVLVQLLMGFTSAVILGAQIRRTLGSNLLSYIRPPTRLGQVAVLVYPEEQGGPLTPPGSGFLIHRRYAELRLRFSNPPSHLADGKENTG